jgi:hypothetical protein
MNCGFCGIKKFFCFKNMESFGNPGKNFLKSVLVTPPRLAGGVDPTVLNISFY